MADGEKDLLHRAQKGDLTAFEQLISGYQKKVFNIALKMLGNHEDASEAAQEALIKVFRSISGFKEESSISTWIYRIATNTCLDELRKRKNNRVVYLDEEIKLDDNEVTRQIEDDRPTPDILAEQKEIRGIVQKAVSMLSEDYRTVIVLRDIQGFSYQEIASITRCPEGTVKSRINRARQELKRILERKKELPFEDYVK